MDFLAILALVEKGITVVDTLIAAEEDAAPALASLTRLVQGAQAGTLTQAEMDKEEALLDGLISDFNKPIV